MTTFLDRLLDAAHARVRRAREREPLADLRSRARASGEPRSLRGALTEPGVAVIAEIKRASPSAGALAPHLDARRQGLAYVGGGAAAVSVLTEPDRFAGSLDDLRAVAALDVPTLRKDFTVDPYQVWEAREAGAAAVLLIVAALDDRDLARLSETSHEAGLDVLVEVHDAAELERAAAIDPAIVGVNARDLRTFEVDQDAFVRLRPRIPADVLAVAESGIRDAEDVRRAAAEGADAVLVGESLVTAADPRAAVEALVRAGRGVVVDPQPGQEAS